MPFIENNFQQLKQNVNFENFSTLVNELKGRTVSFLGIKDLKKAYEQGRNGDYRQAGLTFAKGAAPVLATGLSICGAIALYNYFKQVEEISPDNPTCDESESIHYEVCPAEEVCELEEIANVANKTLSTSKNSGIQQTIITSNGTIPQLFQTNEFQTLFPNVFNFNNTAQSQPTSLIKQPVDEFANQIDKFVEERSPLGKMTNATTSQPAQNGYILYPALINLDNSDQKQPVEKINEAASHDLTAVDKTNEQQTVPANGSENDKKTAEKTQPEQNQDTLSAQVTNLNHNPPAAIESEKKIENDELKNKADQESQTPAAGVQENKTEPQDQPDQNSIKRRVRKPEFERQLPNFNDLNDMFRETTPPYVKHNANYFNIPKSESNKRSNHPLTKEQQRMFRL